MDDDAGGLPFVVAVGAYTVAAHRPQRHVQVAAGYMYAVLVAMLFNDNPGFGAAELATSGSMSGGAMLVGWTLQTRWRRTEVLERDQGEAAARAAAELPPGVELAAYRIVQEALTNAARHARAEHATVRLDIDGAHRRVVVTDDGRDGGAGPDGQGLIGMRERVAVYGGTLDIGRRPDGGYRVVATRPPA